MKSNAFKYIFFTIVILLIIVAFYIFYKDGNNKSLATEEKKLQISIANEINIGINGFDTLNPLLSNNRDWQYIAKLVFDPLLDITKDFKIENKLAIEFSKINSKSYIVKLRDDVYWHDNSKFTSEDVIFTIEKLKDDNTNSIYKENIRTIEKVEKIDDYTIKIILNEETPYFAYKMCFPILNKDSYKEESKDIINGTGKYKINNIQENLIELVLANENNKSSIKKINVILSKTTKDLYDSFSKGELDYIITDNINYEKYLGTMGYNVTQIPNKKYEYLVLNNKNSILSNSKIRIAINMGIDKSNINYNLYNSKYIDCKFPLQYISSHNEVNYDLNESKNILVQNGWIYKNNIWRNKNKILKFNLVVHNDKVVLAEQIKNSLGKVGISINIIQTDTNSYNNYLKTKNYDMILKETVLSSSPNLEAFFGANNLSNYNNKEILDILKDIKSLDNQEMIDEKNLRILEIYNQDIPFVSLYCNSLFILTNKNLKGDLSCNWYNLFYNIDGWYKIKN